MTRFAKNKIKQLLDKRGYEIVWTQRGQVSGTNLSHDLPLLLPLKGAVCFDVGANTGQTLELLTQALHAPRIHSFEPTPSVFTELAKSNWGTDVHLHNIALGSSQGTAILNLYELSVLNSLLPLDTQIGCPFADVSSLGTATINVSTLDDFVSSRCIEFIDLLKIDTQGYDFEVLKGGQRILSEKRVRHVLVELNYINLYERQSSPWEIESHLASHGFRLVDLYEIVRTDQAIGWCTALFRMTEK